MDFLLPDDDTMEKMACEYAKARRMASVLECKKDSGDCSYAASHEIKNKINEVKFSQNADEGINADNGTNGGDNAGGTENGSNGTGDNGTDVPNGLTNGSDPTPTEEELREAAIMQRRVRNTAVILMFLKSLKK
ncbi:MAG: hypothetical protein ACI4QU_04550 [Christensenellales bacterium]